MIVFRWPPDDKWIRPEFCYSLENEMVTRVLRVMMNLSEWIGDQDWVVG